MIKVENEGDFICNNHFMVNLLSDTKSSILHYDNKTSRNKTFYSSISEDRMESQKEGITALIAEVRENATPFARIMTSFYDQITSIANDRNIPIKDVMAVLATPLQPRLQAKRERGPSAFNLFTADIARGNGDLAAAAALWKNLPEEKKKDYDPSVKVHDSPKKKRCYKPP